MDAFFPIGLLAFEEGGERRNAIFAMAAHNRGASKLREEGMSEEILLSKVSDEVREQIDDGEEDDLAWAAGTITGRHFINAEYHRGLIRRVREFLSDLELYGGTKSPVVRIHVDLLNEAFTEGAGLSYREFTVLCAVYSCIGSKPFDLIRREQISMRIRGAWSAKVLARLRSGNKAPPELSLDRLRYTLDQLEGRSLLTRISGPSKRDVFYTRILTVDQLADAVMKRFARNPNTARKAAEARLKAAFPTNPHKSPQTPTRSPEGTQNTPHNTPHTVPASVPTSLVTLTGDSSLGTSNGDCKCADGAAPMAPTPPEDSGGKSTPGLPRQKRGGVKL